MATFPPELLLDICELACTDDGTSFRALSLVSSYFNRLVVPLRYQSLVVQGPDHIVQVVKRLEGLPEHLRRIRHLFVSTSAHDSNGKSSSTSLATEDVISLSLPRALNALLCLAAPTLFSLTVVSSPGPISTPFIGQVFRISYPMLTELTVVGYYPFPTAIPSLPSHTLGSISRFSSSESVCSANLENTSASVSAGCRFPRLERLHLEGNRNPHGILQPGCLPDACPSLTHLRVSGLRCAGTFLTELESALCRTGEVRHRDGCIEPVPALPPKIVRVEVQAAPAVPAENSRSFLMRRSSETAVLERLVKHSKDMEIRKNTGAAGGTVKFAVHESLVAKSDQGPAVDRAKKNWIARLNGGNGCWME